MYECVSKRVIKCDKLTLVSWRRDHAAGKHQKQAHAGIRSHVDETAKSEGTIGGEQKSREGDGEGKIETLSDSR